MTLPRTTARALICSISAVVSWTIALFTTRTVSSPAGPVPKVVRNNKDLRRITVVCDHLAAYLRSVFRPSSCQFRRRGWNCSPATLCR